MSLMDAVSYPFRSKNAIPALLIPALIYLGGSIVSVVVFYAGFFALIGPALFSANSEKALEDMVMQGGWIGLVLLVLVLVVLMVIFMSPMYGYSWAVMQKIMDEGPDADAPVWSGNVMNYFMSGIHLFLAYLVMIPLVVLAGLTLGLLAPFCMTPFILASRERTFMSVMRNIVPGFSVAASMYGPLLLVTYVVIAMSLVYGIVSMGISFTLVGTPFVTVALMMSVTHYMMQKFVENRTSASMP